MTSRDTLIHLLYKLTDNTGVLDFYIEEAKKLEKKEQILRVCDLDDTLFGRKEQLEKEELLRNNRGAAGISVIANTIGIHAFIKKYYEGRDYPQDIRSQLDSSKDIILTAGMQELQYMKAMAMGLDTFTIKIVWEGKDKILEMIRYVLFELRYIPAKIIVYEDRPQCFIEHRKLIEGILGCKLTIMYVEMNGNEGYKKIEEVK